MNRARAVGALLVGGMTFGGLAAAPVARAATALPDMATPTPRATLGATLALTPSATNLGGAFTAAFAVPRSLSRGAHAVSVIGDQSRIGAMAARGGDQPPRAQFYMAGGMNTSTATSELALLNTDRQPARVYLTLYFDSGATYNAGYITAPASSMSYVPIANFSGVPSGIFGVAASADRPVAAELTVNRPGMDGGVVPGSAALSTRWYLAAGSTDGGQENVSVLNPSAVAAHVRLLLVGADGHAARTVAVTAPAHTNKVVDVDKLAPNQGVSIVASSDRPVLVARSQTFGVDGRGLTIRAGATTPATRWIFAAGTTANGVQTNYTVLNPGGAPAAVTASFYARDGTPIATRTVSVAPRGRATLRLDDVAKGDLIAAVFRSNQAVVAERSEYTGSFATAKSGSVVLGRNGVGARWIFPSGDTAPASGAGPGSHEALVLFNPSAAAVTVEATFYDSKGKVETRMYTVPPTGHTEIAVNTLGLPPFHGVVLRSANGQGFIAEDSITTDDGSLFNSTQGLAL